MKKVIFYVGAALMALSSLTSCNNGGSAKSSKLVSHVDTASYALGMNQGSMLLKELSKLPGDSINKVAFLDAFTAALNNDSAKMRFTEDECIEILQKYFSELEQLEMEKVQETSAKNKLAGQKFMEENAHNDGVITTASGLQYKVITEGKGAKPKATDVVKVNYVGKLLDGTVFDASEKHGQPAVFPLNGVVAGWTEGLQLMNVGSKYEFVIPSNLAYGERGAGDIEPGSTLIFEVELLEIMQQPKEGK